MRILLPIAALILAGGCVRTVGTIMTAPVKVVSKGADWATTSQDEADRNRGREDRKRERREAKEARQQQDQ